MKRLTALACCLMFVLLPVVAAAQTAPPPPPRQNADLYWGGVVLAGLGGAMIGHGVVMPAHTVTCFGGFGAVSCIEEGGNKALWIGMGAGVMAAGFAMSAIGGKRVKVTPQVTPLRKGFQVSTAITF